MAEPSGKSTRHIEKAGTGILDMIGLCKAAKLRPPEFRQEMGQFIQTLWRPTFVVGGPVGAQSEAQSSDPEGTNSALSRHQVAPQDRHDGVHDGVHDIRLTELMRKILVRLGTPASTPELLEALGYPRRTRNYSAAMKSLLNAKMIAMTQPEAPRSKNQKYRLTDKGRTRIEENA